MSTNLTTEINSLRFQCGVVLSGEGSLWMCIKDCVMS